MTVPRTPFPTSAGRRIRPQAVLGLAALALFEIRAARADDPGLWLDRCVPFDSTEFASALALRLGHPVGTVPAGEAAAPDAWALTVDAAVDGAALTLRSPAGDRWTRDVILPAEASRAERLRTTALAAEYLIALARAPFLPASAPPVPTPPAPEESPEPPPPPAEPSGLPPAPPPPPEQPSEPPPAAAAESFRLDGVVLPGGAGDLSAVSRGKAAAFCLGLRLDAVWSWGLWIELDAAWHGVFASAPEELSLHQLPARLGVGAALPFEEWSFRLAFQAVFEPWWTVGGTARSGWRTGGGLVLSVGRRVTSWLAAGVDLGIELMPHGIELLYGDEPVFSLGPWRGRGAVWIAFGGEPAM